MGIKVIKDFKYKGRRCVIIEICRREETPKDLPEHLLCVFAPYCNGYIELRESEILASYNNYDIKSAEITYQGNLEFYSGLDVSDGKTYIGFDSAHSWNDKMPESKTAKYVENTCKKIVDELESNKVVPQDDNNSFIQDFEDILENYRGDYFKVNINKFKELKKKWELRFK